MAKLEYKKWWWSLNIKLKSKNESITFECSDGTAMDAHLSRTSDAAIVGPQPAIIVIHEAWGLNNQIKGVATRYTEEGGFGTNKRFGLLFYQRIFVSLGFLHLCIFPF